MSNLTKSESIQRILNDLYPNPPAPLNHHSDFTFLVAVILSAQTTDGGVNIATKDLFKLAPDAQSLAKLQPESVLPIIQRVGLAPKKSKFIVETAKIICEKYNGRVPDSIEELKTLPGVGHKTASVVLSHVHGIPAFGVDTHVHRLAVRWGICPEGKSPLIAQELLCKFFPEHRWNVIHLQMIYFGREFCSAKIHKPSECPICSWVSSNCKPPPTAYESFPSKKPAIGIVYYRDRIKELLDFSEDQQKRMYSPQKSDRIVLREENLIISTKKLTSEFENDTIKSTKKPRAEKLASEFENNSQPKRRKTLRSNNLKK